MPSKIREVKKKPIFCPISVFGSKFNHRNTQSILQVKIIAILELKQKSGF